ncbi:hypothetical protein BDN72DRAFT_884187 [Pluteus cervinus]|uniref:Uncharacterized protein n=1 Tax=Pluteus cervinus TaxID=181527 RepID=A0ACD2ZZ49_9AGAR|nr:hypothetical protein BDN72DRAFT_884187 [Pluteus cervinus]
MAIGHAVEAHTDAYVKAGVLLRDVSAGNVMANLLKDGTVEGFLIDWDMAIEVDVQPGVLYVPERTGTWYFLAARLLSKKWDIQDPTKGHCRIDDIESFVHLLVYIASHFTPHEWGASGHLSCFIRSYFEECITMNDTSHGGTYKRMFLVNWGSELTHVLHNNLLASVISRVCKVLASCYPRRQIDWDGQRMLDPHYMDEDSEALSKPYWLSDLLRDALKKPGWDEAGELVVHHSPGMDAIVGAQRSHVTSELRIAKGYTSGPCLVGGPDTNEGEYSNATKGVAGKKRKRGQ